VIAVYDSKWFMRVVEIAKRRGTLFTYYYTSESVPYGSVVYTDYKPIVEELKERTDILLILDQQKSCKAFEYAILASMFSNEYRNVVVGIDPGHTLSYVVLGDDNLILYGDGDLDSFKQDFNYVLNCVPHVEIRVKVGTGYRCAEVIEYIKRDYASIPVELVDETSTTPSSSRLDEVLYLARRLRGVKPFRHKDIYAAYRIALSRGIEVI